MNEAKMQEMKTEMIANANEVRQAVLSGDKKATKAARAKKDRAVSKYAGRMAKLTSDDPLRSAFREIVSEAAAVEMGQPWPPASRQKTQYDADGNPVVGGDFTGGLHGGARH